MFASARKSRASASETHKEETRKPRGSQGAGSEVRSESAIPQGSSAAGPGDSNFEAFTCRVVARVRPKRAFEAHELQGVEVSPEKSSVNLSDGREQTTFTLDEVIDSTEGKGTQAEVFDRVGRDILAQTSSGFSVFLIAFGATGSGKTFTTLGSNSSSELGGLLPRSLKELFLQHSQDPKPKAYSCEYFEVYNDQIRDLLAPSKEKLRKVHMHPKLGVRIEGLTSAPAKTPEEALSLLNFGNQMRAVSATTLNDHFARSHAFFTLKFDFVGVQDAKRNYRTCETSLTFVDLAGSEDLAAISSEQVSRDMCHIDSSIAELSQLVSKLAEGQRSTSLRKSKLNMLLSQALLGNCKTVLIATLAPTRSSYHESWSTLNFASSLRKIKTKVAPSSKVSQPLAQELEAEVRRLRKEVAEVKTGSEKEAELAASQAWLAYYKESLDDATSEMKDEAKVRRRIALKLGLAEATEAHPRTESGQPAPFLTKLTDDAAFHGSCNHFMRKAVIAVGSDSNCDLALSGIGMRPLMCEFRLQSQPDFSQRVTVQLSSSAKPSRVIINGEPLKPRIIRTLSHGDSILLGYAHAFRLVVPSEATLEAAQADAAGGPTDATTLARSSLASLDLTSALCEVREDGQQFQEALAYAHKLSGKVVEELIQAFVRSLHILCPLVDEANLITAEVFGDSNLSLKLQALTPEPGCLPELVISVTQGQVFPTSKSLLEVLERRAIPGLQARVAGSESSDMGTEGRPMKYFWSLDKFLCRLREMRDVYQEGLEAKDNFLSIRRRLERRYGSPWHELNLGDIQSVLPDLGSKRIVGPATGRPQATSVPAPSAGYPSRPLEQEAPASPRPSPRGQTEAETGQVASGVAALRARSPTPVGSVLTRLGSPQHIPQLHGVVASSTASTVGGLALAAVHAASAALPNERGATQSLPAVASDGSGPSGCGSAQIGPLRSSRNESPDGLPPGVSRRDLDDLRTELGTCRQETGRLFTEQGRLAGLLDRFESLLGALSHPAVGQLLGKGQSSPRQPSPRALHGGQASQTPIVSRQASSAARGHQVTYLGTSSGPASMHVPASGSSSPFGMRPRRLLTPPPAVSRSAGTVSDGSAHGSYLPETEVGASNLAALADVVTVLTETLKAEAAGITPREAPRMSAKELLQSPMRGRGEAVKSPRALSPASAVRVTPHRLPLQTVTTAPLVTLQASPESVLRRPVSPRPGAVPVQNSSSVPAITAQQQKQQLMQLMTKYQVQAAQASPPQKQAATQQTFNIEPVTAGFYSSSPPHPQPQVIQLHSQQTAVLQRQLSPGRDEMQTLRSPRLSQTQTFSQTLQNVAGGSLRVIPPQQPPAQAAVSPGRPAMLSSPTVPSESLPRLNLAQVNTLCNLHGNSLSIAAASSAGGSSSVPPADGDDRRRGSSLKVAI